MPFLLCNRRVEKARKRLVAKAERRECACKRAAEPSVIFCEKEERRREREVIKNRRERYKVRDDVELLVGLEPTTCAFLVLDFSFNALFRYGFSFINGH